MDWTKTIPRCKCRCESPGLWVAEIASVSGHPAQREAVKSAPFPDFGNATFISFDGTSTTGPTGEIEGGLPGASDAEISGGGAYKSKARLRWDGEGKTEIRYRVVTVKVAYFSGTTPPGEDPPPPTVTFEVGEVQTSTSDGDGATLAEIICDAPTAPDNGTAQTYVVGPAPKFAPIQTIKGRTYSASKVGFHAYRESGGDAPKIYKRETLSGRVSGVQFFTVEPGTTDPEIDPYETPIIHQTYDGSGMPTEAASLKQAIFPLFIESPEGAKETATVRVVPATSGPDQTATLSEEYSTADLRSQVDGIAEAFLEFGAVDLIAETILAAGETYYSKGKRTWKMFPGGYEAYSDADTLTLTVKWDRKTRDAGTGLETTEAGTQSVTMAKVTPGFGPNGGRIYQGDEEGIEMPTLVADNGKTVRLVNFEIDEEESLAGPVEFAFTDEEETP